MWTRAGQQQPQAGWSNSGAGHQLGGGASEGLTPEEKRQKAIEAAERRQVNLPGLSEQKAKELTEKRQKDELLGKLSEHYNKKKLEMPMGLNSATSEQLRKHWETIRTNDVSAQVLAS